MARHLIHKKVVRRIQIMIQVRDIRKSNLFLAKKRVDAINRKEGIVKELKPNNPRAIKRGEKLVQQYVDELNRVDPLPNNRKWKGIVETYDR